MGSRNGPRRTFFVRVYLQLLQVDSRSGQVPWECSQDLCKFISTAILDPSSVLCQVITTVVDELRIVELGCGLGDPTCSLLTCLTDSGYSGKIAVLFQDYNQETIDSVTRPNVESKLSHFPPNVKERIQINFMACPWDKCDVSTFHIILSSECIYREDLFESFADVLDKTLSVSNSVCYVAAKRYYFGCGGGTIEFSEFLSNSPTYSDLHVNVVHVEENGFSNTREILEIHR